MAFRSIGKIGTIHWSQLGEINMRLCGIYGNASSGNSRDQTACSTKAEKLWLKISES